MGSFKVFPEAAFQTAPYLALNDTKARYSISTEFWRLNAETRAKEWPMSIIEAACRDFMEWKHFSILAFCSSDLHCPVQPASYEACGTFAPQGTFVSTRVLHALKHASAYFQSKIPPPFGRIQHLIKAQIIDRLFYTHKIGTDRALWLSFEVL